MKKLTGSIVALVTPFHEDGSVDFARLRELCDWHIANGTDAILALGTTGETASTSLEEDIKTLECVIDHVNGRVPVIAGAGSNSSEMQKHKSVIYSQMGAAALLCISPYYVKTNEEGMYRHFMMSADAATAPIILYNVPGRTGCKISPDVVRRLSVHPNVMAIKEASGDIGYAMKVARYLSDDFTDVQRQRRHHHPADVPRRVRRHLRVGERHAAHRARHGHGLSGRPPRKGSADAAALS